MEVTKQHLECDMDFLACFGEGHEGRHPVGVWEWWDGDSSPIKGNRGDSLDSRKTRKGQGAS